MMERLLIYLIECGEGINRAWRSLEGELTYKIEKSFQGLQGFWKVVVVSKSQGDGWSKDIVSLMALGD